MRRAVMPLLVVTVVAALIGGTAYGKQPGQDAVTVSVPVTGTFTPSPGTETVLFTGTLTVDRFAVTDGQLAIEGMLAADEGGPFGSLAVTVVALASAAYDAATGGCTVTVGTVSTLVQQEFLLFLEGTSFGIGEVVEADLSQELCRVVRAVDNGPANQAEVARALNKVLGMS
jgi:hypothetical protein